jgi:vitamin B12 transporter
MATSSSNDASTDDAAGQGSTSSTQSMGHITRRGAELRGITTMGWGIVGTFGGSLEEQQLRTSSQFVFPDFFTGNPTTASSVDHASRTDHALFAEAVSTTAKLTTTVGARLDGNQKFGDVGTFRVGAKYGLLGDLSVRGNIGTAFREPSMEESFSTAAFDVGNPKLKPEHSKSWEAGLAYGGPVSISATFFDQRFVDMIQYNGNVPSGETNYQNIAKANARGFEVELHHPPVYGVGFDLSATRLNTKVIESGFDSSASATLVKGSRLLRRPDISGSARLNFVGIKRLRADVTGTYVGKRDDRDFSTFPAVPIVLTHYTLIDASAEYALPMPAGRPNVSLTVRGSNLTDETYHTVAGYQSPGMMLLLGARVSY